MSLPATVAGGAAGIAVGLLGRGPAVRARLAGFSRAGPTGPAAPRAGGHVAPATTGSVLVVAGATTVLFGARAPLVVLAGVAVLLGHRGLAGVRRRRLRERIAAAVPDIAFGLGALLRAGHPPAAALAVAAEGDHPLSPVLAAAAAAAARGDPPGEVIARAARPTGVEALTALGAVIGAAASGGVAVGDLLDRLGEALDADAAARARLLSSLAGPRATALLLAGLPVVGMTLGEAMGAAPLRLLVHRPLGWGLAAAAAVLDGSGIAWTTRILRSCTGSAGSASRRRAVTA